MRSTISGKQERTNTCLDTFTQVSGILVRNCIMVMVRGGLSTKSFLKYNVNGFKIEPGLNQVSVSGEKCRSFIELTPGEAQGEWIVKTMTFI